MKETLRATIVAGLIPTSATGLRGMARVNAFNTDTALIGLVERKTIQLLKRPTVQFSLRVFLPVAFATSYPGRLTNVSQVLKDDGSSCGGTVYKAFGEDMIAIPVEALLLATQALQVAFGRPGSFGLQVATQTEPAAVNLFPVATAKKLAMTGHGRAVQSQIDSDHLIAGCDKGFRHTHNDMQPELALALNKISARYLASGVGCMVVGNGERNAYLPHAGREPYLLHVPLDRIGFLIIADRAKKRVGTRYGNEGRRRFASFESLCPFLRRDSFFPGFPRQGAFHRLRRLHSRLNKQVADQARTGSFRLVVHRVMQLDSIALGVLPAIGAYRIERSGKLAQRLLESVRLLRGRMQLESHGSVHAENLPYMSYFCQMKRIDKEKRPLLRKPFFPPRHECAGFPERNVLWKRKKLAALKDLVTG